VRDSPNPITFDTGYTAAGTVEGNSPPTMRDITLHDVRVSGGGKISFNGYAKDYRIGATLDNALLTDSASYTYAIHHTDLVLGPGPVNLRLEDGVDSTVLGKPGKGAAAPCADKFVPFPRD
jgi:polygalacturonase